MTTTVKRNDKLKLRWQIVSDEGVPQDLSDASVKLLLRLRDTTTTITKTMIPEGDPDQGIAFWENDGTLEEGLYDLEIEVTKGDTRQTAPSGGYGLLYVKQDLG